MSVQWNKSRARIHRSHIRSAAPSVILKKKLPPFFVKWLTLNMNTHKITHTHTHNVPSIDDLYITCAELNNQILNHFLWIIFDTICHPFSSPILVMSMKLIIEATHTLTHRLSGCTVAVTRRKEGRGRLVEQGWLHCLPVPSCCSHSSSAALFKARQSTVATVQYSTVQYSTVQEIWSLDAE